MTPTQQRYAEAYQRLGSLRAVARECKVAESTVRESLRRFRKDLQDKSNPPGKLPAPGFYAHTISTSSDGKESVKWRREELVPEVIPSTLALKGVSQLIDGEGRELLRWNKFNPQEAASEAAFWAAAEMHVRRYSRMASPVAEPAYVDTDLETWYPLGDPHLGLLAHRSEVGTDADLRTTEKILEQTVELLISRSPASGTGVICQLGDYFHSDSNANRTMSGHQLDVDSRHVKVAEVGFNLMRRLVERALQKHGKVVVINAPGNHAPNTEKMMVLWLKAVFERDTRVDVVANTNPYIYRRFGCNLVGVHHGDGGKQPELPEIMAADCPKDWGDTTHRYWYCGHLHRDSKMDHRGCSVEIFRTLQSPDMWSHHAGYRSERSLQAITLHREWGEQGRVRVGIRELQQA